MPAEFIETTIEGLVIIQPKIFPDNRGEFAELYKYSEFSEAGIADRFVQTNFSRSKKGVLRGLHYQMDPASQGKLMQVLHGAIFDVAVDIRKNSPTYGKWLGITLTAERKNMLFIPKGFAHGLCVLEDDTYVVYNCTSEYSPEHERGLRWDDPALGITWPIDNPIIADRDAQFPTLDTLTK
ncbi:MAG: dTDP-4-dehydrorhamnose 3,5-epimerase [Candidatus Andersenbacteria bacterium RIFCSPHIGHO2_12_FULL_45_11b]|uniref:dTDP-4-dehydrorhamnose 3,5-epimerase n=1 Tax=Candidatus Andersenbacteria bacterium RIFCSPHIGHO2_12_FULL_45_11b TaxID=1797282 RepID=A0A1G1XAT2_9BACT|nr:MAG: dTDP-4-dehydrorhamnose 3,5-epimerase [Candidatus Andersenbacteria bacterium RIFCSPHIGHO2_12_FULL_45_11b]